MQEVYPLPQKDVQGWEESTGRGRESRDGAFGIAIACDRQGLGKKGTGAKSPQNMPHVQITLRGAGHRMFEHGLQARALS